MSQFTTTPATGTLTCPSCQAVLPADAEKPGPTRLYGCPLCYNVALLIESEGQMHGRALESTPAVEDLAPAGSVMEGVMKHLNRALEELPVLPQVPMRVIQTMHDPLTSMGDLAEIIDEDPAISLKVLRISNSALYAGTHEIKDLHVACARLGLKTVANVVHTIAQRNVYRTNNPAFRETMSDLWKHAVAAAHAAEVIASIAGPGRYPGAFVGGLVHDIGKLLLLDILSRRYKGRLGRLQESEILLHKVLHHFHTYVGVHVVQYWRLPPEFGFSTFYCDRPDRLTVEHWSGLAHVVSLGSAVADAMGFGLTGVDPIPVEDHPSASAIGLDIARFKAREEELSAELQDTLEAFAAL